MKSNFLLFVALIFCASTYAQENLKAGYIIKNDDTKEAGYLEVLNDSEKYQYCRFHSTYNSKGIEYKPLEILGYSFIGEKPYYSINILDEGVNKYVFGQEVLTGNIKLYSFTNGFLITKEDSVSQHLNKENFHQALANLFKDCSTIQKKIAKQKFNEKAIIKIIGLYDNCPQYELNSLKTIITDPEFEVLAGLNLSSITTTKSPDFSYLKNKKLSNQLPLSTGVYLSAIIPIISKKFSISVGGIYSSEKFSVGKSNQYDEHEFKLKFQQIQIPLLLRYQVLSGKKIGLTISGGVLRPIILSSSSHETTIDSQWVLSIYIYEREPIESISAGLSTIFGMHADIKILKRSKLQFHINYQSGDWEFKTISTTQEINAKYSAFTYSLGVVF